MEIHLTDTEALVSIIREEKGSVSGSIGETTELESYFIHGDDDWRVWNQRGLSLVNE